MALGHGSKKSVSCDQVVIPAPLDNGVSNEEKFLPFVFSQMSHSSEPVTTFGFTVAGSR